MQLYIQRDIRGYTPVAGDLAYPDKLLVTADIAQDREKSQSDSDSVFASGTEVIEVITINALVLFPWRLVMVIMLKYS